MSPTVKNHHGCVYCGPYTMHVGMCPKIAEIEYHPNGTVRRVVLRTFDSPYAAKETSNAD